ncbi:acetyltransferase cereus [Caudoviricetes sp.]|nr:MAG: acetyltransferase [Podoviridae sp. ct2cs2]UOF77561.1 acetyltransferase cereus [Caudoviricetes sp.]
MILHYIPKDNLRQHWEYVRHGLELVRARGHNEWLPEDVYCDCYENRSMLFIGIIDNKPVGFVVLQPIGNRLHVWASWSTINDQTLFMQAFQEIQSIAKQGGKTKVTFNSERKGWERRARQMGFKPQTWEYTL